MPDPSLTFAEPLIQDVVPRRARCAGTARVVLSLLISLGFAEALGWVACTPGAGGEKEPAIAMVSHFHLLPNGLKRSQPSSMASNRFQWFRTVSLWPTWAHAGQLQGKQEQRLQYRPGGSKSDVPISSLVDDEKESHETVLQYLLNERNKQEEEPYKWIDQDGQIANKRLTQEKYQWVSEDANKPRQAKEQHPRTKVDHGMEALVKAYPDLKQFLVTPKPKPKDKSSLTTPPPNWEEMTIDFNNASSVHVHNAAILNHDYGLEHWNFPEGFLRPSVPGRANYIHHLADMVEEAGLKQQEVVALELGVGASAIYPLIGTAEYGWRFVGSDTNQEAIESAQRIVQMNKLARYIDVRQQYDELNTLVGVVKPGERFVVSLTNPPFLESEEALRNDIAWKERVIEKQALSKLARKKAHAKRKKAKRKRYEDKMDGKRSNLNEIVSTVSGFGGQISDRVTEGGEVGFISRLMEESASKDLQRSCLWFTSLVSKKSNLDLLRPPDAVAETRVVSMRIGKSSKPTRFVAWTFVPKEEREAWVLDYRKYLLDQNMTTTRYSSVRSPVSVG